MSGEEVGFKLTLPSKDYGRYMRERIFSEKVSLGNGRVVEAVGVGTACSFHSF